MLFSIPGWTIAWLSFWAFLGLKLSGAWASAPWWAITMPIWGYAALCLAMGIAVGIIVGVGLYVIWKFTGRVYGFDQVNGWHRVS